MDIFSVRRDVAMRTPAQIMDDARKIKHLTHHRREEIYMAARREAKRLYDKVHDNGVQRNLGVGYLDRAYKLYLEDIQKVNAIYSKQGKRCVVN